jgi:dipeptidyl aminopeptidase/acylaminoacyl peptidase
LIKSSRRVHQQTWWLAGATVALTISIITGLEHQRGLFDDYRYRLAMGGQMLLAAQPVPYGSATNAIALLPTGYRRVTMEGSGAVAVDDRGGLRDELSLAASGNQLWTETAGLHSVLESSSGSSPSIFDAESPALVADGTELAFLREIDGRKQLFVRDLGPGHQAELQLTTAPWNVEEIADSPNQSIIVSATRDKGESRLYTVRAGGAALAAEIPGGEARYPAVSPDGHWLAFSTFRSGYWNLSLRDMNAGTVRRLTTAPCNQTEPAWLADSRTLLYSSDCGRALGFTAICKRRVLP